MKSGPSEYQYVVRPNRSLTWREASTVYGAIATVILVIGIGCYLLGLKLVLPFSGLEAVALGAGFYLCLARGEHQEVVSISADWVVVERGRVRSCLKTWRAQAEPGARGRKTAVYEEVHEDFEPERNEVMPSAVVFKQLLGPIQRYEFQRYWVRVVMERPANAWYPSRLKLRSHGKEVEVGAFLDEEDR